MSTIDWSPNGTGRMLGSKTGYISRHPDNVVAFNAVVFTKTERIWWGDLDLTRDLAEIIRLAQEKGEDVYVLRERDGFWLDNGDGSGRRPDLDRFVARVSPSGAAEVRT